LAEYFLKLLTSTVAWRPSRAAGRGAYVCLAPKRLCSFLVPSPLRGSPMSTIEKDELAQSVQNRVDAAATADKATPENHEGLSKSALKKLKKQEKAGKKNKMSKEEKEALFQGT
ncbi:hypothetical protein FOZ62_020933, partial [Perkinsus olseni]